MKTYEQKIAAEAEKMHEEFEKFKIMVAKSEDCDLSKLSDSDQLTCFIFFELAKLRQIVYKGL